MFGSEIIFKNHTNSLPTLPCPKDLSKSLEWLVQHMNQASMHATVEVITYSSLYKSGVMVSWPLYILQQKIYVSIFSFT